MKTIHEMIEVMKAFENGKTIEFNTRGINDEWEKIDNPLWNWHNFDYRIKPEPKYVPYASVSEIDRSKWVRNRKYPSVLRIIGGINTITNKVNISGYWITFKEFFETFEYEDGTPCGKGKVDGNDD